MNTFVVEIDASHLEKLTKDLKEQGFTLSQPPHTHFCAKKSGVCCTFYKSGKLSVQGKLMKEFIEFYLEPEILKTFTFSHQELYVDRSSRIGIDEAGKGDFFGPLCVAGVYCKNESIESLMEYGVKDSKRMNDKTIGVLAQKIKKVCTYHIVQINPQKYNEIYPKFKNLNSLLAWGHATCIENLVEQTRCEKVIIDQFANESVVIGALEKKGIELDLIQRHRGEEDIVVAAASILARDAFLKGLAKLSKMIDIELPKGAGEKVIQTGKTIHQTGGDKMLYLVAKEHFKTWKEVINH